MKYKAKVTLTAKLYVDDTVHIFEQESALFDTLEEAEKAMYKLEIYYIGSQAQEQRYFQVLEINDEGKEEVINSFYVWNYIDKNGSDPIISKKRKSV